ncbi:unnamed protein product [Didymodactylos carnosus]|uniref:Uncharacterized protein n=1 Tax=Didymodactylos carnosus TaxID=1234261 RepID=A0A8S2CN79_9BILA|nr:unnamed protein product [Didymodactylos carnosus]CAF3535525.1 unnamed protein product [Didymodactylos carnosus]
MFVMPKRNQKPEGFYRKLHDGQTLWHQRRLPLVQNNNSKNNNNNNNNQLKIAAQRILVKLIRGKGSSIRRAREPISPQLFQYLKSFYKVRL